MKEFLTSHIGSILAYIFGAGGLISAITERKKRKTDALSGMQDTYDKFVNDADKKFDDMRKEINVLKENHKQEITKLLSKIKEVEAYWRQKYNSLKKAFDTYKKNHP